MKCPTCDTDADELQLEIDSLKGELQGLRTKALENEKVFLAANANFGDERVRLEARLRDAEQALVVERRNHAALLRAKAPYRDKTCACVWDGEDAVITLCGAHADHEREKVRRLRGLLQEIVDEAGKRGITSCWHDAAAIAKKGAGDE